MPLRPLIALLTDFGTQDAYVASMKGVMLGLAPDANVVDITHAVPPQDVYAGAFLIETCIDAFPRHTTYLCVVDPGVGTQRTPLVLQTPLGVFVGPDNGLFSYVLARHRTKAPPGPGSGEIPTVVDTPVPPLTAARVIANASLLRETVSRTFHGRDVFAPVAAYLAKGGAMADVGPAAATVQAFTPPRPERLAGGSVGGRVLHVDGYGNLITNLRPADLPPAPRFVVGSAAVEGLRGTYAEADGLLALTGSSGFVEIALRNGSAAEALGAGRWAEVTAQPG